MAKQTVIIRRDQRIKTVQVPVGPRGAPGIAPFRLAAGTPGRKPQPSERLFRIYMKTGDILPANLEGSRIGCDIDPANNFPFLLKKNGVTIFTGTILAGATMGSWSVGPQVSFVDDDILSGECTTSDTDLTQLTLLILGIRAPS